MKPCPLDVDVVVPTVGRASLTALLDDIEAELTPRGVIVVDDRPEEGGGRERLGVGPGVAVLHSGGRGPAAARNRGWRAGTAPWVVFIDDDVRLPLGWGSALARDLARTPIDVAAVSPRLEVPLPVDRRPTDWERNIAGLATAQWVTAEVAVRRAALVSVGGFDERFLRAYREDTDLALRLRAGGWRLVRGRRRARHPVRSAGPLVSVRLQAGNVYDPLLDRLHGRDWRAAAGEPLGRFRRHLLSVGLALGALGAAAAGQYGLAATTGAAWAAVTGWFAWERIAPGPRTPKEVLTMVATSIAIPPAAVWFRSVGFWRARHS